MLALSSDSSLSLSCARNAIDRFGAFLSVKRCQKLRSFFFACANEITRRGKWNEMMMRETAAKWIRRSFFFFSSLGSLFGDFCFAAIREFNRDFSHRLPSSLPEPLQWSRMYLQSIYNINKYTNNSTFYCIDAKSINSASEECDG